MTARTAPGSNLLPLDEAETERDFPREDQPPPVARSRDGRAWEHPQREHPDDLLPNAAAQDDAVASNFHVIKRHPIRAVHHDDASPVWLGGSGGRRVRRSVLRSWEPCAGVSESSRPYTSFDGGCKGRSGARRHRGVLARLGGACARRSSRRRRSQTLGAQPSSGSLQTVVAAVTLGRREDRRGAVRKPA